MQHHELTHEEFVEAIRQFAKGCESQAHAADRIGVSPSYLSDIVRGRRGPGEKIAQAMGFRRKTSYVPVGE